MLAKQPLSNQRIIHCLHADYGIEVVTLTLLPLGADMNASVYKAQTQDQLSYFIKLKYHYSHSISLAITELLHHAGIQQIIFPIKTIHGELSKCIDDVTLIVYPFIEGQNGFSRALTDEQWLALGKTLRQIHEINLPSSVQHQLRREAYSSQWRDRVRSLCIHNETEPTSDKIALELWAFIKKNKLAIQRLVDRAEQLAQRLQNESFPFVLCHSDIHGGNVLMNNDETFYIIDWDDLMMAPKERDLMFIGGGVGNVWNKSHEEMFFYKGYGETEINKALLAYYRHERIVEDIALYSQDLFLTAAGGESRAEMYKHFIAMFEPRGVIDVAFKTDHMVD
jgi:spectinomycin phosphotransferase